MNSNQLSTFARSDDPLEALLLREGERRASQPQMAAFLAQLRALFTGEVARLQPTHAKSIPNTKRC